MSAVAPHHLPEAPGGAEPRVEPRPRPLRRAERRPRVAEGIVWIVLIGALLAGVVFMNVAVLRLNLKLDEAGRQRTQLQADNAALASELSSASAAARVQAQARGLGLVEAKASETNFVHLPARP
jgi:cell division protein FtsL